MSRGDCGRRDDGASLITQQHNVHLAELFSRVGTIHQADTDCSLNTDYGTIFCFSSESELRASMQVDSV